jgi:hypothetical protein
VLLVVVVAGIVVVVVKLVLATSTSSDVLISELGICSSLLLKIMRQRGAPMMTSSVVYDWN